MACWADENLEQFGVDRHGRLLGCLTELYQRCREYPRLPFCGTIASMTLQMLAGCSLLLGALQVAPAHSQAPQSAPPASQRQPTAKPSQGKGGAPQSLTREAEAYYQFLLGRHLEAEGDAAGAMRAYSEAARLDPTSAEIRVEIASLHARENRLVEATAMAEAGVATAEPVLLVESDQADGPSFFVTRRIEPAFEVRQFFRRLEGREDASSFPEVDAASFLAQLGSFCRSIHDAGVWYRDLSMGNVLGSFNLDVALTALEKQGRTRLLSSPKVTTQNNKSAEIKQGVQIPIQTLANNTVSVQFKDAVLTLRVTPQITDAGTVILDLEVENNAPDYGRSVNGIPPINTQQAKTQVLVKDGQTAVVGGIFQSTEAVNEDRTPFLGNVPVLGYLFRRKGTATENAELLLFITPRIVKA